MTNVLWWGLLIMGDYACEGGGGSTWEIFVLSLQFCCESKTTLKNKVFFLKYISDIVLLPFIIISKTDIPAFLHFTVSHLPLHHPTIKEPNTTTLSQAFYLCSLPHSIQTFPPILMITTFYSYNILGSSSKSHCNQT